MSFFGGTTNWDELGAQTVAIAGDGMLEPQVRVRRVNQLIDKGVPVDYEVGGTAILAPLSPPSYSSVRFHDRR